MQPWMGLLEKIPRWGMALLVLGLTLFLGLLDWLTGDDVSLSFFYLLPIFLAAWTLGVPSVLAFSVLSTAIASAVTFLGDRTYSHTWILLWNSGMRLASLILVGLLVVRIRRSLLLEQSMARTDSLTEILNRRAFEEVVIKELDRMERSGVPVVLVTFDLDDFKAVNDAHGHGTGDRVLKEVGRVLRDSLRQHDVPARMGGDEFAVLLPMTNAGQAYDLMLRVKTSLEAAMKTKHWPVGFSFGAVEAKAGDQFATLLDRADLLMYRVKHDGKNGILVQNHG